MADLTKAVSAQKCALQPILLNFRGLFQQRRQRGALGGKRLPGGANILNRVFQIAYSLRDFLLAQLNTTRRALSLLL